MLKGYIKARFDRKESYGNGKSSSIMKFQFQIAAALLLIAGNLNLN